MWGQVVLILDGGPQRRSGFSLVSLVCGLLWFCGTRSGPPRTCGACGACRACFGVGYSCGALLVACRGRAALVGFGGACPGRGSPATRWITPSELGLGYPAVPWHPSWPAADVLRLGGLLWLWRRFRVDSQRTIGNHEVRESFLVQAMADAAKWMTPRGKGKLSDGLFVESLAIPTPGGS